MLEHDFLREGKLALDEDVLIFGKVGEIMGVEFLRSWFTSCGMEINAAGPNAFKAVERLFIAPTLLGNHFVHLESASNGKALMNHQLYTTGQLAYKLDELLGGAFAANAVPIQRTLTLYLRLYRLYHRPSLSLRPENSAAATARRSLLEQSFAVTAVLS